MIKGHVTLSFYVYACTVRRREAPVRGALGVFAMMMMMMLKRKIICLRPKICVSLAYYMYLYVKPLPCICRRYICLHLVSTCIG